jgi:hypothetical protein
VNKTIWINKGWQPIHLGFCPSKKAWDTTLREFKITDEPYPTNHGRCTHLVNAISGEEVILITVNLKEDTSALEIVGLIVHESVHAFDYICESIGEDKPSTEFKAYSIQAIAQEMINAFTACYKDRVFK